MLMNRKNNVSETHDVIAHLSRETMLSELANGSTRYIVILVSAKTEYLITIFSVELNDAITIFNSVDLSTFDYIPGESKLQLRRFENDESWDIIDSFLYANQPRNRENPKFKAYLDQVTDDFLRLSYLQAISGAFLQEKFL
ncbi:hypothetical protein PV783_14100 [Chitinophaga sp. CC14]|uniref:hypothetical protein n=1 Tax=Chitinophaga sp. CC14 TaxID=3029199 RepID=UPI003B789395